MKRLAPILLLLGAAAFLPAHAQTAQQTNPTYNPDPGAAEKPVEAPFLRPPPGTPPDYGSEREPLLDLPHEPPVDLYHIDKTWKNREYPDNEQVPPNTKAVPNRWFKAYQDIPLWKRYNTPEQETPYLYRTPEWDPYKQSVLKGDLPIIGQDIFLSLTATSFTSFEARDIPTPASVSTSRGSSSEFFGLGDQQEADQFFSFTVDLFKGETVFQPLTWNLHLQPVYNINYTRVRENSVISVDPRGSDSQSDNNGIFTNVSGNGSNSGAAVGGGSAPGLTPASDPNSLLNGVGFDYIGPRKTGDRYITRTKDFMSLQEAYLEFHLADLTSNYDFVSMRAGNQPFISDFRGFVFDDTNFGVRFFGNADSNRWQYNVAAFDMREKDTYSELNTFNPRDQYVFVANVYRQDFLAKGYTAQLSFLADLDQSSIHYDRTGNLTRPEILGGPVDPHEVKAYYFGWNGDGHIGRYNITHSFYEVLGHDDLNGLAGRDVDINAQMAAVELSYDQDWIRYTASFFYGSGDDKPDDGHATGFDSIMDNPNFVGGPFSYYVRQGFVFGDTAVGFKQRNSLVLDLRSSKDEGQANFDNPGVFIYGVGTNIDLLPTTKLFLNANYIRMATVEPVDFALHTANVTPEIGWDLSGGIQYRPLLTDNIIISAGLGALIPGDGYKAIYETTTQPVPGYDSGEPGHVDNFLYSGFAAVTLTY